MIKRLCSYTALMGLAFLVFIPNTRLCASSLRDEAVSYRIQGYEAQQHGETAQALMFYQKAIALDPTYAAPCNDLGILREAQGDFPEAEKAYRQALDRNPDYLEAHTNLAMLYERMGDKEKASYHWLKRYQLGDPYDPWTVRAEERLTALGVLQKYPGLKGESYARRRVLQEEFDRHDKSLKEFHAVTSARGN